MMPNRRDKSHRRRAVLALLVALAVAASLFSLANRAYLAPHRRRHAIVPPYQETQFGARVLSLAKAQALEPGDSFQECATDCPQMIVVPAGSFIIGSPASEQGHKSFEQPQHRVSIAKTFAVSKFELTFAQWDACAVHGGCAPHIGNAGFGRGRQPVINVSWSDAKRYAAWLSNMTGKPYRLLSEAEYEYAARAGTQTAYPWGNAVGIGRADCDGCGSKWDDLQTAPVGSFAPNGFGLYDMVGNVFEWVEDCLHPNYDGAPTDGSAWIAGGSCGGRMIRGGSWADPPLDLRCAARPWSPATARQSFIGFRVARTLVAR